MQRSQLEQRLATVVRNNRLTIAVTFPLVGVALLVGGRAGVVPEWLAFNPVLIVGAATIMALPLIAGLLPTIDRRAAVGLGALTLFAWGIELTGVNTGFPYGEFEYQTQLGPMLLSDIPVALPVFYFPILINAYLLAVLALGARAERLVIRYPVVVVLVVLLDLILDPGAVELGFWAWEDGGIYYGVPVQNFLGWVLSGSVAVAIIHLSFDHKAIVSRLAEAEFFLDDLINFCLFWGLVNLVFGNVAPVLLTAAVLVVLFRAEWFDFAGLGGEQVLRGGG